MFNQAKYKLSLLKIYLICLIFIYMESIEHTIEDIKVIEQDIEKIDENCKKINCAAVYDSIMAIFKLLYDLFRCCRRKDD